MCFVTHISDMQEKHDYGNFSAIVIDTGIPANGIKSFTNNNDRCLRCVINSRIYSSRSLLNCGMSHAILTSPNDPFDFAVVKKADFSLSGTTNDDVLGTKPLYKGGNVYIIGGTAVVSESFEKSLTNCKVTRLGGSDRYETNLEVLKTLGVTGASDIMVASGLLYPDALSASATGNPVLLVGKTLTDNQKAYLATLGGNDDYYVIGGTAAVNATVMNQLKASKLGDVVRLEGNDRYETAAAVAEEFFGKAKTLVIASGNAFPDGLTGGVLANAMNAPLMLVNQYNTADAAKFADDNNVKSVVAIGGTAAISNAVLNAVA